MRVHEFHSIATTADFITQKLWYLFLLNLHILMSSYTVPFTYQI